MSYDNCMNENRPKVGIGILVVRGGQVLLGKRKNAHGEGEWGGPGGHMELNESFEDTVLRELEEEVGPDFKIKNPQLICVTNLRKYAPKHYVDIGMVVEWVSGEPQVMEPEKLERWQWFDINDPPAPLFGAVANYFEAYKTGQVYFAD